MKNERILSMQYPLISEYVRAIQDAQNNLDKLAHLSPVLDDHGEPYRSSGAFAVVFKMKDEQTGKCYALKCFTEEQEGRAEAYRRIADELEYVGSPYVVSVRYLEKELFVDCNCEEEEFPVLLMDWIEGDTMETYIANNSSDSYAMSMLCYRFCKMAAWLRSQPFAHGDIKPDNIIVRSDGTLTLVDYDGMFVPAMKGQKSPTIGTKDFSHPLRTIDDFDETIDDFALATIALSLKAISLDSSLFNRFGASDRLLFSANDYLDLSKSQVLTALQGLLVDEEIRALLSMLLLASAKKDLSTCSFRLFDVQKPKEEEMLSTEVTKDNIVNAIEDEFGIQKPKEEKVLSTEVTKKDLANAVIDKFGVKYSIDGKRLLKASQYLKGKYVIRDGVRVICDRAFKDCSSLESIIIPNSVTSIGGNAFESCGLLLSVKIPDGVKIIGDSAFPRCKSLASIILPRSIVSVNGNPFARWNGCLQNESESFIYENDVLFNKDKTILIAYRAKDTNYVIPDGVIKIGDGAFSRCESLINIVIPDSVTSIGDRAFSLCSSLISIAIPGSVTSIGVHAFEFCRALRSVMIPNSVTSIGKLAFWDCPNINPQIRTEIKQCFGEKVFWG